MSSTPYPLTNSSSAIDSISQQINKSLEKSNESLTKEIDTITDANDHISFVENIIQKHSVSNLRKKSLLRQLQSIKKRTTDATLHLALLGEFSSGKSTFINALLRQRLLKSARVATTASATYIAYGNTLSVRVTFSDNRCIQATESNTLPLCQAISQLGMDLPKQPSLQKLLDLLTSDQEVANWVKRIDISLPEQRLKSGLSIIDTPGIGAGADYTQTHAGVTQSVVEESADAAIVLIPSSQPMSDTLISFLRTTAKHFLHRCVFVVTAMDDQEEEQREQITDFVKHKLKEKLGLVNPVVLESAAITMIPIPQIPSSKQEMWSYWQERFIELETTLLREMIRQRSAIISERLVYLLQSIFVELKKDVEDTQRKLAHEKKILNTNSVTAIEEVLNRIFEQGIEKISRQGNYCKSNAESKQVIFHSNLKAKLNKIIEEAKWNIVEKYDDSVEPKIREASESEGKKFVLKVNEDIEILKTCCKEVSSKFREQFERNYQKLRALGVDINIPSLTISSISITSVSFDSHKYYAEQVSEKRNNRANWGTGIGGIAGLIVGGPWGAAAGAAIGRRVGRGTAEDLETCRQEIYSRLGKDVERYVDKYLSAVKSTIDGFVNKAISDLESAVQVHLIEYGEVVSQTVSKHQEKSRILSHEIRNTELDSTELNRRKQKLEIIQSNLLQI